jgi:hypothetical protein
MFPGVQPVFCAEGLILRVVASTLALSVVFTAIVSFPANPSFAILNPNSRRGTHRSQTGESNCHQPYLLSRTVSRRCSIESWGSRAASTLRKFPSSSTDLSLQGEVAIPRLFRPGRHSLLGSRDVGPCWTFDQIESYPLCNGNEQGLRE